MKHLFIINPAAGSRNRTQQSSEIIHKVCRARGLDYEIRVSTAEYQEYMAEYKRQEAEDKGF